MEELGWLAGPLSLRQPWTRVCPVLPRRVLLPRVLLSPLPPSSHHLRSGTTLCFSLFYYPQSCWACVMMGPLGLNCGWSLAMTGIGKK